MQATTASRSKRPASSMSPAPVQPQGYQQPTYPYQQQLPENPDFNLADFNQGADQAFTGVASGVLDPNDYSYLQNVSQPPTYGSTLAPALSTDLVRRARSQQLAPQNGQQHEQWNGDYGSMNCQPYDENEQELALK
ncbi:Heat shock transcription factor, partial [Teratosphaeriaceae sp. CCFEE 6253]